MTTEILTIIVLSVILLIFFLVIRSLFKLVREYQRWILRTKKFLESDCNIVKKYSIFRSNEYLKEVNKCQK